MSGEFEPNDSRNVTGTASTPDGRWTGQGQQPPLANGESPRPTGPREHETRAQGGGGAGGGGLSSDGAGDMSEDVGTEDVDGEEGVQFHPDRELIRKVGEDGGAGGLSNEGEGEDMENRNMGSESGAGANTFTGPSGGAAGNSQAGFGSAGEGAASQGANQGQGGQGMGDQSLGQSNESGWPGQESSGTERSQQQQFAQGSGQMGGGETGQPGSLGEQIREHMTVVDAEGTQVGTVDSFENDQIKLTRSGSADGQHHYLPIDRVAGIEGDTIRLHDSGENAFGSNGS